MWCIAGIMLKEDNRNVLRKICLRAAVPSQIRRGVTLHRIRASVVRAWRPVAGVVTPSPSVTSQKSVVIFYSPPRNMKYRVPSCFVKYLRHRSRLCGDDKEDGVDILCHCRVLACQRYRTWSSMFSRPKGPEKVRVSSLLSLVDNTF